MIFKINEIILPWQQFIFMSPILIENCQYLIIMTLCFQGNLNEIWFEIIILLVSLWQHKINTIQGILKHYVCISINGEVFNLTQVFPYDKCFHMMMIPSLTLFCGVKILICFHKIIKIRLLPEITAKESKKKICSIQISKLQFSFWGLQVVIFAGFYCKYNKFV